jgi:hypothetical protein
MNSSQVAVKLIKVVSVRPPLPGPQTNRKHRIFADEHPVQKCANEIQAGWVPGGRAIGA